MKTYKHLEQIYPRKLERGNQRMWKLNHKNDELQLIFQPATASEEGQQVVYIVRTSTQLLKLIDP